MFTRSHTWELVIPPLGALIIGCLVCFINAYRDGRTTAHLKACLG